MKNKDRIKELDERLTDQWSRIINLEKAIKKLTPTDSLKMEERPQPIEGVEFAVRVCKAYGIRKGGKTLYWYKGAHIWQIGCDTTTPQSCHLVPVDKYTVGRVYRYGPRPSSNEVVHDYCLCIDVRDDYINVARWSDDEMRPITLSCFSKYAQPILEVQTIQ